MEECNFVLLLARAKKIIATRILTELTKEVKETKSYVKIQGFLINVNNPLVFDNVVVFLTDKEWPWSGESHGSSSPHSRNTAFRVISTETTIISNNYNF